MPRATELIFRVKVGMAPEAADSEGGTKNCEEGWMREECQGRTTCGDGGRGDSRIRRGLRLLIALTAFAGSFVAVSGAYSRSTIDQAASRSRLPPENDQPTNAEVITGLPVKFKGTTKGATQQGDEPLRDKSVWYRWKAPRSAEAFLTLDVRYGGKVDLFSGSPGALLRIPLEKTTDYMDRDLTYWSVHESLVAGAEYYIAVSDGSRGFSVALADAVPKAKARTRETTSPFDLRIPVKLSADVPADVRMAGEIYVRPHQDKQEELWRLSPQRATVRPNGSTRVRMRLPRMDRERGCKAILYALTLKDVRGSNVYGRATFTTADGKRTVVRWSEGISGLSSGDRPEIRQGRGRC